MAKTLHFLYLEDSDLDVQIFTSTLEKEGLKFSLSHVKTRKDYIRALEQENFDLIFSDYALPAFDGLSALEMAKNVCPATPFIIVSGNIGEELAIETLKRGATDYVLKSHFTRLVPSIRRALEEKQVKEQRKTAEEIKSRYNFIVNSSRSFLSVVNRDYTYEAINNAFCSAHNLVREEIIGKKLSEIWGEENFRKMIKKNIDQTFSNKEIHYQAWFETPRDGLRCFEVSFYPYKNEEGDITHTVVDTADITEKKRAEQALRESEEKYRTLVERALDGIVIIVRGKVAFANSYLLNLAGYTHSEVIGSAFARFIHPDYRDQVMEIYNLRQGNENVPAIYETVLQKKDGTNVLMEINVGMIRFGGESGELIVLRDITERKKTEEALRTSEIKFKSFIEQTPEGIVIIDEEGTVVEWNTGSELLTGVMKEETLGGRIWDAQEKVFRRLGRPFEKEHYRRLVLDALRTGRGDWLYRIDEAEVMRDGEKGWVQSSVFPIKSSRGFMLGSVSRDITQIKQAEIELRNNRDFFETLNDYIGDGVISTSFPERTITYANKACLRVFGYREEELVGKNTAFLWPEEKDYQAFGKALNAHWKKGETVFTYETVLCRKSGERFYADLTISLMASNGRPDRVITVIRDSTERRVAQEKIRQQTEDLSLINELNNAVNEGKTLPQILGILSASTRKIFSGNGASVLLLREDKQALEPAWLGLSPKTKGSLQKEYQLKLKELRVPLRAGHPYHTILKEKKAMHFTHPAEIRRVMSGFEGAGGEKGPTDRPLAIMGIKSLLSVPLFFEKESIGIMDLSRAVPYTDEEIRRIVNLSGQVSSAISRKLNEERIRDSEARYRMLFETANDGIILIRDGRVVECNKQTINIFGYPREEFIGMSPAEFSPPQQPDGSNSEPMAYEKMSEAIRKGPQYFEWLHKRADGTPFFAEVSLNKIQIKGHNYLQAIVRDISEKKKAGEEQARLITAIEQSAETVVITDLEGVIRYVNPAFEKTTGYSRSEALGQNPSLLKSGKQTGEFYTRLWDTITGGKVWKGRIINKRKDGSLFEEQATISPIRDEKGRVVNYVAVKRDITRESQLESQLRQVQKMETIGTLAGGIAHDFNNILATIMGYTDMVLKEMPAESDLYDDIRHVMKASNRGKELVKKILTFSRQVDQRYEPVHLDLVLKESIDLIKPSLPNNIRLTASIDEKCEPLMGDPTQLQQVVMNLCTNAAYALRTRGGRFTLSLRCINAADPILERFPQQLAGRFMLLEVKDDGPGMKPEVASRIFEPFFTTKPVGEGTGLGLSVTHGIVKSMGGEIVVETEPGKGATFLVLFPLETAAAGKDIPEDAEEMGGHEQIMIVDDEEEFTTMVGKMLKKYGYRVTTFNDPSAALKEYKKNPSSFDLLLLDQVMPGYTGIQMAEKIRLLNPQVPLILVTGYVEAFPEEKIRNLGFSEYLCKPITSGELNNAIRNAFRKTDKSRS